MPDFFQAKILYAFLMYTRYNNNVQSTSLTLSGET